MIRVYVYIYIYNDSSIYIYIYIVIPKTFKMVFNTSLLNTQQYNVRIKGKVEQSRKGMAPSPTPRVVTIEKIAFWSPSSKGRQLYFLLYRGIYLNKYIHVSACVRGDTRIIYIYIYRK